MNKLDQILRYEQDELNNQEVIELFQNLVDSGLVWELQDHYKHTARYMINEGYIRKQED